MEAEDMQRSLCHHIISADRFSQAVSPFNLISVEAHFGVISDIILKPVFCWFFFFWFFKPLLLLLLLF